MKVKVYVVIRQQDHDSGPGIWVFANKEDAVKFDNNYESCREFGHLDEMGDYTIINSYKEVEEEVRNHQEEYADDEDEDEDEDE
jgi:hypothetical protein